MTDVVEIMIEAIAVAPRFDYPAMARNVLTALESAGWCVVPREPTEEMIDAGAVADGDGNPAAEARNIWSAMLSAAPRPGE